VSQDDGARHSTADHPDDVRTATAADGAGTSHLRRQPGAGVAPDGAAGPRGPAEDLVLPALRRLGAVPGTRPGSTSGGPARRRGPSWSSPAAGGSSSAPRSRSSVTRQELDGTRRGW